MRLVGAAVGVRSPGPIELESATTPTEAMIAHSQRRRRMLNSYRTGLQTFPSMWIPRVSGSTVTALTVTVADAVAEAEGRRQSREPKEESGE